MRAGVLLTILLVLGPKAYVGIRNQKIEQITTEDVGLVVLALGVKGWQRIGERDTSEQK